ncbi:DNA/RNA helicase domain-containing protein [Actinomadura oligospora]|uniref:DNA/RNA helicase domain-containing protein n=1 Tax=Actinomadura oligospora TaxID=111804 RepID=UPI0006888858|nr:DNA/RNA helicase domain-containing protein [Actinomadura oligospora]
MRLKPRYLLGRRAADLHAMDTEDLVRRLVRGTELKYQVSVTDAERRSWRHSIRTVTEVLLDVGLGDVRVLLEMSTLVSNSRIDMLLVGTRPRDGELAAVAIENKQWSALDVDLSTRRITVPKAGRTDMQHPAEQVWDYCRALERNLPMLRQSLWGVVNLHEASDVDISKLQPPACRWRPEVDANRIRIFGSSPEHRRRFGEFLRQVLSPTNADEQVSRLDRAHVRPTEDVMRAAYQAVRGRSIFPLLDRQREVVDRIVAHVTDGFEANSKQVFIISGGPGTGKTVLALELLGILNGLSSSAVHASGSSAFSETLRNHVKGRHGSIDDLFTYFNQHRNRAPNHLNVLICDEAHRLRKSSNTRFEKAGARSETPQIHELIQAARVPVFLLDPRQVIRNNEIGTPEAIHQAARELQIPDQNIHRITLERQFRHSTCPEYIDWLEDLLGYGKAPRPWTHSGAFHLLRADNPQQMEDYLRAQIILGHSARITAGFCWEWHKKPASDQLPLEVSIGDWARPWNARKPNAQQNIPSHKHWATHPGGFEQIGCVYTAQSFDWDYAGVIMGYDYTWHGARWTAVNNKDHLTWGNQRNVLIPNIYRVLASRGKEGVVLYSTNQATRDLLAELRVPPVGPALKTLQEQHPDLVVNRPARPPSKPTQGTIFDF